MSALDGEDEEDNEDNEDHSGDNVVTIGHSQLLSCGQVSFASRVDNICHRYESGHTNVGDDPSNNPPPPHFPPSALSIPDATIHVYKVDIMTSTH